MTEYHDLVTAHGQRLAAYSQEALMNDSGQHVVVLVRENEPGYWETTYAGTLEYVRGVATSINESYGLTPNDVMTIVASSFR